MKKGTLYLIGGIVGGVIFAFIAYFTGGSKSAIGGAAIIGMFTGKFLGWVLGELNEN